MNITSLIEACEPLIGDLERTPARFIAAFTELTKGYAEDPDNYLTTTFVTENDAMIAVKGIEFVSVCRHHLLPFRGVVNVGYLPGKVDGGFKIVGLSKLPRLALAWAARLQVQETLTWQIATSIAKHLTPDVGVVVEAEHLCCSCRGIKSNSSFVTSCMLGRFREQPEVRQEFLSLLKS